MAIGDIISAAVLSASPHNGWVLEVEIEGWSAATSVAVVGGWDTTLDTIGNDPAGATPKGTVNLTSQGYSESGGVFTLGTRARTVYVSRDVRKAHPNSATIDTATSGSNLKVKVSLTDYVYSGDTAATLTVLAGLFTSSLGSSAAVSGLSVTNSSTKAYPKVKAVWVDAPGGRIGSTYDKRLTVAHPYGQGQPVVGVLFTLTDEDANTVSSATTTPVSEASTRFPTKPRIQCYKAATSTTSLTDGKGITVRARAYPYIGDATSVFDSNAATGASSRDRIHRLDRAGTYRRVYAYVNPASPSGTPASSTNATTARAAPYASIEAAATGAVAYINANYASSANSLEGAEIVLMDNAGAAQDFIWGRSTFVTTRTAPYAFCVIRPDALNTGRVRLRGKPASTPTQNILCPNIIFRDLPIEPVAADQANYFTTVGSADYYIFDRCDFKQDGTSTSNNFVNSTVEFPVFYECGFEDWYLTLPGGPVVWPHIVHKMGTSLGAIYGVYLGVYFNSNDGHFVSVTEPTMFLGGTASDGFIASFDITTKSKRVIVLSTFTLTNSYVGHGVMRMTAGTGESLIEMDGCNVTDCFFEHLSLVGDRFNPQNGQSATDYTFDRFLWRGVAAPYIAYKGGDYAGQATFGTEPVGYGVGIESTWNGKARTFPFRYAGLRAYEIDTFSTTAPNFDQVDTATDATPIAGSKVLGLVGAGRATSAFDFKGNAIANNGTGAAGAIQLATAVVTESPIRVELSGVVMLAGRQRVMIVQGVIQ